MWVFVHLRQFARVLDKLYSCVCACLFLCLLPLVRQLDLGRDERVHKGKKDTLHTVNGIHSHKAADGCKYQTAGVKTSRVSLDSQMRIHRISKQTVNTQS